ncbi:hypothetical protein SNE40_002815 [Patella caerulea]|uniref:C2 PI3K-type domain-containing protein n=1 Tax=Patella caerulea TaxID=87958 RepID=A0AAN8K9B8_PATCE
MLCDNFYIQNIFFTFSLQFDSTPLCALPKESRLCITLIGLKYPQNNNQDPTNKITRTLGGATIQLFSQRSHLVQGNQLVPLQMGVKADHLMPSCKTLLSDSVLLQVNLPDFDKTIFFPAPNVKKTSDKRPFDALHPEIQDTVLNVLEKESSSV